MKPPGQWVLYEGCPCSLTAIRRARDLLDASAGYKRTYTPRWRRFFIADSRLQRSDEFLTSSSPYSPAKKEVQSPFCLDCLRLLSCGVAGGVNSHRLQVGVVGQVVVGLVDVSPSVRHKVSMSLWVAPLDQSAALSKSAWLAKANVLPVSRLMASIIFRLLKLRPARAWRGGCGFRPAGPERR